MTDAIPTTIFRSVVEDWFATHEMKELGLRLLSANSGLTTDAWRKRLSDRMERSKRTGIWYPNGWYCGETVPFGQVDEFLTAADAPHLWYEPPLKQFTDVLEKVDGRRRLGGESRVKRLSKASLLTREQLFMIHRVHIEAGLSLREICRQGWEGWGYASEASALNSIGPLLHSFGLKPRDRREATAKANELRSTRLPGETKNEAKARRRRERGEVRGVMCKGIKQGAPRKGTPCRHPARKDSEYCFVHDPANQERIHDQLALMRVRAGIGVDHVQPAYEAV